MALTHDERQQFDAMREDVAYLRGKFEHVPDVLSDHEDRLRKVERRIWGVPGSVLAAIAAVFGFHFGS